MTRRETRVVNAFLNCIKSGEYSVDYAITLIEDNRRYGYLNNDAKDYFYMKLDEMFPPEPPVETIPEMDVENTEIENPRVEETALK